MKIRALLISAMLTIVLIVTKLITAQTDDCGLATYEDADGLVVIESENLPIADTDWSIKSNFNNVTSASYLSWNGNNNFNSPGNGLITTKIKINTPEAYRFR
jgi:hypothetical protein